MAHILVIDDDEGILSLAAETLRHSGHVVTEASNGKDGLASFRAAHADLVITDLVMPVKEGIETIMELHRDFPATKIIAISGAVHSRDYLQLAGRLGAVQTLAKPFTAEGLLSAVNTALASANAVRQ